MIRPGAVLKLLSVSILTLQLRILDHNLCKLPRHAQERKVARGQRLLGHLDARAPESPGKESLRRRRRRGVLLAEDVGRVDLAVREPRRLPQRAGLWVEGEAGEVLLLLVLGQVRVEDVGDAYFPVPVQCLLVALAWSLL